MQENPAGIFSENWNVYQKLLRHNYMHHAYFTACIAGVFKTFPPDIGLSILDMGCGDASQMVVHLKTLNVDLYKGYDLSKPALMLAAENLGSICGSVALLNENMETLLKHEQEMFDIIYSSFAIHHLQDDQKKELLVNCFERLNKNGVMIYTDTFRHNGQSRDTYLNQYIGNIESSWVLLNKREKQLICDHVTQFDFPSALETTLEWITKTGFHINKTFQPDAWHTMLVLSKK